MSYWKLIEELAKLGIDTYNFKEFVKFRHRVTSLEVEVSRDELPRKHASSDQCNKVFNFVKQNLIQA